MKDTVMICGSGGREHVLAIKYSQSELVEKVIVTPGNHGMIGGKIDIDPNSNLKNSHSMLLIAKKYSPNLIDVAQDYALAAGTVDLLIENGYRTFGPTKNAARIEWDKEWSRKFMKRHNLPTPAYETFYRDDEAAITYANEIVSKGKVAFFKANGLYGGKGVISASNEEEVEDAFYKMMLMKDASLKFLVEEGIIGEEFSYYAIVKGNQYKYFKSAQDNKKAYENDLGPNTGGIGSNAPCLLTRGLEEKIQNEIMRPAILGLFKNNIEYTGILYLGGIISENNSIGIIEFNARWGDPEMQTIVPGIKNDYYKMINAVLDNRLNQTCIEEDALTRICLVGVSKGYPDEYEIGKEVIINFDKFPEDVMFASAAINKRDGKMYNFGGRVFNIIAHGKNIVSAREKALLAMKNCEIEGNNLRYRGDIAEKDIRRFRRLN